MDSWLKELELAPLIGLIPLGNELDVSPSEFVAYGALGVLALE